MSEDELRQWRDGLGTGRDRIVAHLAGCDPCGARLAELLRTSPAAGTPAAFDADAFLEAGRRAGEFRAGAALSPSRGPRRSVWRYVAPIAAAAAIVVAVVYVAQPFRTSEPVVRGGAAAVRLVEPSGSIERDKLKFAWEGPAGAYRLRVFDLDTPDNPVIARDEVTSGYQPAADERAKLRSGVAYRWFVERPEANATSPAGRFTVR